MNHKEFLHSFKAELKKQISTDLEKSLEALFNILNDQTELKNELIHLEGRYNLVQSETIKGIITYETRTLQINRIRDSAIQLIEKLDYKDLETSYSPELKTILTDIEASTIPAPVPESPSIAPSISSEEILLPEQKEITAAEKKPSEQSKTPTPFSISEFEFFVAQHQQTLAAYPRIYRKAREITLRRDAKSAADFHQTINTQLESLQKFEELLKPIRDNIKQIRLNREHEMFWLQYKMIKEVPATLEIGTLESLPDSLPKLQRLHDELLALNLISY